MRSVSRVTRFTVAVSLALTAALSAVAALGFAGHASAAGTGSIVRHHVGSRVVDRSAGGAAADRRWRGSGAGRAADLAAHPSAATGHVRRFLMSGPASTSFPALGTTAVVVADPDDLDAAVLAVGSELDDIDRTCSRFRADSDVSRVNDAGGAWTTVDRLLVEAVEVALRAASITGGLVDPTVGEAMLRIGYDRDFAEIPTDGPALPTEASWLVAPAWRLVEISHDRSQVRAPRGVRLDLGSTAKALAADRAASRAADVVGGGVLVSLGGDIAVAGGVPEGGWLVGIADDHHGDPEPGETVGIVSGGLATSSTTVRRWARGGRPVHHIVDPRTGLPAREVWRTVSVTAGSCVDANTASTASIVLGEDAPAWLASHALPARLVRPDGAITRVGGWPERAVA